MMKAGTRQHYYYNWCLLLLLPLLRGFLQCKRAKASEGREEWNFFFVPLVRE